jgi:hypothetical protein
MVRDKVIDNPATYYVNLFGDIELSIIKAWAVFGCDRFNSFIWRMIDPNQIIATIKINTASMVYGIGQ